MNFMSLTFLAMMDWNHIRSTLRTDKLEDFDTFKKKLQEVMNNGDLAFHGDLEEDLFMAEAGTYIFTRGD